MTGNLKATLIRTCEPQYRTIDLAGTPESVEEELTAAIKHYFPDVDATVDSNEVQWHSSGSTNDKLQPLSALTSGKFKLAEGETIHLHRADFGNAQSKLKASDKNQAEQAGSGKAPAANPDATDATDVPSMRAPQTRKSATNATSNISRNPQPSSEPVRPYLVANRGDDDIAEKEDDETYDEDSGEDYGDSATNEGGKEESEVDEDEEDGNGGIEGQDSGGQEGNESDGPIHDPQPTHDINLELKKIPADSKKDSVFIKLIYSWTPQAAIAENYWQPHLLEFTRHDPLEEVFAEIEAYVNLKFKLVGAAGYKRLNKQHSCFIPKPSLQCEDAVMKYAFDVDARGKFRIMDLENMYRNSTVLRPELTVLLRHTEDWSRKELHEPWILIRFGQLVPSQFFRIGSISSKKPESEFLIPVAQTYFWECIGDSLVIKSIVAMPTRRLHGHDMFTAAHGEAKTALPDGLAYEQRYIREDPKFTTKKPLKGSIVLHEVREAFEARQRINTEQPFNGGLTMYCFNKPISENLQMGVAKLPSSGVAVALHFVCHLEEAGNMSFDHTQKIDLDHKDTYQSIRKCVLDNMRSDDHKSVRKLLTEQESWQTEFWLGAQGTLALFKYEEGDDICDFLDPDLVAKKDQNQTLYMEVHILPVVAEKETFTASRSGRLTKAVSYKV